MCNFCDRLPSIDNITKGETVKNRLLKKPDNAGPPQFGFAPGQSNFLGLACTCCKYWTPAPTLAPTAPTTAPITPTTEAPVLEP